MQNTKPKSNLKIMLLFMAAVLILSAGLIILPGSGAQPVKAAGEQLTDQSYGPLTFYETCQISVPDLVQSNFISFTVTFGTCQAYDKTTGTLLTKSYPVTSSHFTTSISAGVFTLKGVNFSILPVEMSYGSPLGVMGYQYVNFVGVSGVIKYSVTPVVVVEHTVIFDLNGGTLAGGSINQDIEDGKCAVVPTVTPPSGKSFAGWTVNGSQTTHNPATYPIYGNTTFTAKWDTVAPVEIRLTLKFNGGDYFGFDELVVPVMSGEVFYLPAGNDVIRIGYEFQGFKSSGGTVYTESIVCYSNMTLTAQWKYVGFYTVTFNLNGGTRTGGGALSQQVTPGNYPVEPWVEKDGYIFAGWVDANGNGVYPEIETLTKNTTYKAEWIRIETFEVNFVIGNATRTGGGDLEQMIASGEKPVYPTITPNDPKMQFKGWVNHNGAPIDTATYRVYSSVTLHAQWYMPSLCKVEFVFSDGTAASLLPFVKSGTLTQQVYENEYAAAPVLKDVEGISFVGWFVGTSNVPVDIATYKIAGDTVFRAQFSSAKYTVTFNLNGGTRTGGGNLEQLLTHPTKPVLPTVVQSGYNFLGWKYKVNGTEYTITNVADFSLTVPANIEFTAVWGLGVAVTNDKTLEEITLLAETSGNKYIVQLPLFNGAVIDKKTSAQFLNFSWGKWSLGLVEKETFATFDIKSGKLDDFFLYMYQQEAQYDSSIFDFQSLGDFVVRSLKLDAKAAARLTVYVDEDGSFIFDNIELVLTKPEMTVNYADLDDVLEEEPATYDWWLSVGFTAAAVVLFLASFVLFFKGQGKAGALLFAVALVVAVITGLIFFV